MTLEQAKKLAESMKKLPDTLATCHPKLTRGQVWCFKCGRSQKVNTAECFRSGWPKCCGETMSIDSPEERGEMILKRFIEEKEKVR